jgi:succinate dehydrogenase/fumarate reductase iron-sulfur protein
VNAVVSEFKRFDPVDSLAARNAICKPGDIIRVFVRRSEESSQPQAFDLPYVQNMRVLDALNYIAEHQAPDLAYRWLCGSKMCGTCGVRVNGKEGLACWEAVMPDMLIEPLRNLPVIRDLVVDRAPFEDRIASYEPWIERDEPYAGFPEPLTHKEIKHTSKALDCIGCMSCYSACPVIGLGDLTDFPGPAPLVQLAQTALDPRNSKAKVKAMLENVDPFSCLSCYKCEEVCPAKIPIVSYAIEPIKREIMALLPDKARHPRVFAGIVSRRGKIDPTELVLRMQGLPALKNVARIARLLMRGKVNLRRTLLGFGGPAAKAAKRIIGREKP